MSSFGIESINTWFGTLYFVYGLGLETPKLIYCLVSVKKNSKTPICVFWVGFVVDLGYMETK